MLKKQLFLMYHLHFNNIYKNNLIKLLICCIYDNLVFLQNCLKTLFGFNTIKKR